MFKEEQMLLNQSLHRFDLHKLLDVKVDETVTGSKASVSTEDSSCYGSVVKMIFYFNTQLILGLCSIWLLVIPYLWYTLLIYQR